MQGVARYHKYDHLPFLCFSSSTWKAFNTHRRWSSFLFSNKFHFLTVEFGTRINVLMDVAVYLHTQQQHVQTSLQTYHGRLPVRCGDQSDKRPRYRGPAAAICPLSTLSRWFSCHNLWPNNTVQPTHHNDIFIALVLSSLLANWCSVNSKQRSSSTKQLIPPVAEHVMMSLHKPQTLLPIKDIHGNPSVTQGMAMGMFVFSSPQTSVMTTWSRDFSEIAKQVCEFC